MLAGYNLVYFGPEKWDGLWRNRHWLMSLFARQNRVLYVEPRQYLRRTLADWREGQLSLAPWRWRPISHIKDGLYVYHHPPFAGIISRPPLSWVTSYLRRSLLTATSRRLGIQQPIVWISRPSLVDLLDVFDARLTIYHVVDEYSAYPGQSSTQQAQMRARDREMLRVADLVIVVSQSLLSDKSQYNSHTYMVPNAVHYRAYEQCINSDISVPPDLAAVPEPRLGYIGLIGDKLNFELLSAIARARPAWSLVFLGAVADSVDTTQWGRLCRLSNVHYLGQVPATQVPEYVCGFDVGLMPYRHGRHAENISPLKLYDYLAAGKPVVSINIPALNGFRHVVGVADSPAAFVAELERALHATEPALIEERRRLAAANSWESRVEQISNLIQAGL